MHLIVFQKQQLHLQQVDELTARIKTMEVRRILACVLWDILHLMEDTKRNRGKMMYYQIYYSHVNKYKLTTCTHI